MLLWYIFMFINFFWLRRILRIFMITKHMLCSPLKLILCRMIYRVSDETHDFLKFVIYLFTCFISIVTNFRLHRPNHISTAFMSQQLIAKWQTLPRVHCYGSWHHVETQINPFYVFVVWNLFIIFVLYNIVHILCLSLKNEAV